MPTLVVEGLHSPLEGTREVIMELHMRDVAKLFAVSEKRFFEWIKKKARPAGSDQKS